MMKRFPTFLAVLFVLTIVCQNSPVSAKDTWIRIRSKNFVLVGNASEKDLKQVGVRLEQFREVFSRLFPKTNFSSPVPTTVIVFKSDSSYRPFKPSANAAGYFQAGTDVNYITLTTEARVEQDPFSVIFHEYTHLLVNNKLYLHKEEYKIARQLLEQLNNPNVDETTREHAQALLTQMTSMEEQKARYEAMNTPILSKRQSAFSVGINVDTSEPNSAQTPSDPSSYLQEVLRKPGAGETQLQATLVRIDCEKKAITFIIKTGDRLHRLRTDSFDHVEITTYSPDVAGEITCGLRKPENMVVVCFVPSTDTKTSGTRTKTGDTPARPRLRGTDAGAKPDGTIRSLEFVPKDFKLKQPPGR